VGLSPAELGELATTTFGHAAALFSGLDPAYELSVAEDEGILRDLLLRCASERTRFQQLLAYVVARRAQSPNHLWQDLGLRNRSELSWLMARHFAVLATRNAGDMKWKKFLYRTICRDQSYTLCTAPSCSECDDFDNCFGDESGESRLAVQRRTVEQTDPTS
jgi:nitrogen fixation protein NifQ